MEPRYNEPLYNELLDITNDFLCPGQSYSKMNGIKRKYNEPRYNEFLDITNIIRGPKRKIYLDITNKCQHATEYNNTRQKTNANKPTVNKSFNTYGNKTATFLSACVTGTDIKAKTLNL